MIKYSSPYGIRSILEIGVGTMNLDWHNVSVGSTEFYNGWYTHYAFMKLIHETIIPLSI